MTPTPEWNGVTWFFWWTCWSLGIERIRGIGWTSISVGPLHILRNL